MGLAITERSCCTTSKNKFTAAPADDLRQAAIRSNPKKAGKGSVELDGHSEEHI